MKKLFILGYMLITLSQTYSPLLKAEDGAHVIHSSPLPRIEAVRTGQAGQGYFRIKGSSTQFVPRGANYIRLNYVNNIEFHSTFQPQYYNPSNVISALNKMQHDGYNTVRVFIDPGSYTRAGTAYNGIAGNFNTQIGLNSSYMDNVADFLLKARDRGIYVTFVLDVYPWNQYFLDIVEENACLWRDLGDGWNHNKFVMCQGDINAKAQYAYEFVTELKARVGNENLSTVLDYSLANELNFRTDLRPFSENDIIVETARGTFDMSLPVDRQHAADSNMVYWANQARAAVKDVDSSALVSVGFFTFRAVGKTGPNGLPLGTPNPRFPGRPKFLTTYSNIDFVYLQVWNREGDSYSMTSDLQSIEWAGISGPMVMSEFGARKNLWPINQAALKMKDQQIESCNFNFSGWLFWTWDTPDLATYTLIEQGGPINGQLAPIARPDPCSL